MRFQQSFIKPFPHRWKRAVPIVGILLSFAVFCGAQERQLRNRGENFYSCIGSNTVGPGDIWVRGTAIAHVWDNAPNSSDDSKLNVIRRWGSNFRAFPEIQAQCGILSFLDITIDSRPLSWAFKPGWVSAASRITLTDNKELRLQGVGLQLKYTYNFTEGPPTLGGWKGFMPEGYVVKGSVLEAVGSYEIDLLPKLSWLPVRAIVNGGIRLPLADTTARKNFQMLGAAGCVYSGFGYDFFVLYNVESFNNWFEPKIITTKVSETQVRRGLMFFSEDPMYVTLGGNVRYPGGITLSLAVPILLSINEGSSMSRDDWEELQTPTDPTKFALEKSMGITDGFDPWYVKWKIVASLNFPLRATITSSEMMRNFLIMKNRRQPQRIDLDTKLESEKNTPRQRVDEQIDDQKRLEEIKKRRERLKTSE